MPALPPPDLQVHAWVQAGIELRIDDEEPPKADASIELARLQVKVDGGVYGVMVQLGASDGVKLLDAVAIARPLPWMTVQAGRFKAPLSASFLVPAPKLFTPTRSLLESAVPRRELGIDVAAEIGDVGTVHLGFFDPITDLAVTGPGVRPILAGAVALPGGVDLRVAGTTWARPADWEKEIDAGDAPRWDHELDVAIEWHPPDTQLLLEGLLAHPVDGSDPEGAVTALAAHSFPMGPLGLEVVGAWDTALLRAELEHRLTGGVNLHLDGWHFVASLSWQATFDGELAHVTGGVGRVQLQAGF